MKRVIVLALSLIIPLCVSCQGKKEGKEAQLAPLKLGAMSSLDYIPYVVAEELGYTDSLGLDLEIVKFFSANDRDAAFRSEQVDGTVIDYTGAMIQHAAGMPLSIVAKHDGYFEMMASADVENMQDLKGKRVSVSRNTVIEYATDKMLEATGLSVEEVEKPEVNKIPLRMEMMVAGELEASVFPDPFITISKSKGFHSLSSTRDLGISVTGTIFNQKALGEKKASIQVLLVAYNLAVDYINSHPKEDWANILVKDAGIPEALVNNVVLPQYTHASLPSEKDLNETLSWLKSKSLVPENYSAEGLVAKDFLP